jgi:hypothetical protein
LTHAPKNPLAVFVRCGVVVTGPCARGIVAIRCTPLSGAYRNPLIRCGALSSLDGSGCRSSTLLPPRRHLSRRPPCRRDRLPQSRTNSPPTLQLHVPRCSPCALALSLSLTRLFELDFLLLIVVYCSTPAATNQGHAPLERSSLVSSSFLSLLPAAAAAARL